MPNSWQKVCWFFYVPLGYDKRGTLKGCEMGPTVYRPNLVPRAFLFRTRLFIVHVREDWRARCHYKGSSFSSVILKPWVLGRLEVWPPAQQSTVRCSTNWTKQSAVSGSVSRLHNSQILPSFYPQWTFEQYQSFQGYTCTVISRITINFLYHF